MQAHRIVALSAVVLLIAGCNPFSRGQAVRVSETDERVAARWHGTLSTPQALTGAVQMRGTGWMSPGEENGDLTRVSVEIRNAAPGGVHPWEVGRGHCGASQGVLGTIEDYPPLRIGDDGRAAATATLGRRAPDSGTYFIAVYASPTNRQLVVACGNLAPPIG